MSGMGSVLQLTNPTVVAAFRAALLRQGIAAEALTAHGGLLSVWQLAPGAAGWKRAQVINVAIPYGSSG
jgi:hypothetical protein